MGVFRLSYRNDDDHLMGRRTRSSSPSRRSSRSASPRRRIEEKAAAALSEAAVAVRLLPSTRTCRPWRSRPSYTSSGSRSTPRSRKKIGTRSCKRSCAEKQRPSSPRIDHKAVNAGVRRDENLLAAVARASRDKQILAALNRDDSFKKNVKNIADTLGKAAARSGAAGQTQEPEGLRDQAGLRGRSVCTRRASRGPSMRLNGLHQVHQHGWRQCGNQPVRPPAWRIIYYSQPHADRAWRPPHEAS